MAKIKINQINLGGSNSYLVKGKTGCILVDAGAKGAAKKLLIELKNHNFKIEDIKLIVITHNHYDHTEGLPEIAEITNAPVLMHKAEMNLSEKEKSLSVNESSLIFKLIVKTVGSITPARELRETKCDIEITNDMDLNEYGVDAKLYHVPGHSSGSICLVTADNQCIIGDTLFNMFPGTHYPIIVYNKKLLAESYKKLNKLNCSVYYPGHGKPISREMFQKRIINRKKYFDTGGL